MNSRVEYGKSNLSVLKKIEDYRFLFFRGNYTKLNPRRDGRHVRPTTSRIHGIHGGLRRQALYLNPTYLNAIPYKSLGPCRKSLGLSRLVSSSLFILSSILFLNYL